ncbi:MAG: ATP-grasp domain-containing protein, partial [Oscillospiraceae bacterium]
MNLFEFEGKRLFAAADIPVPEGHFITSASAEPPLPFPFVLKAQVLTGGRGKAGGIKVCENRAQFEQQAAAILGMTIKGHRVHGLLCEQMVHPERELYLSITLQGVARPTLIASAAGGMEIEQVAAQRPEDIVR